MKRRIYGEHVMTYSWIDGDGATVNRCLEVYKLKKGFKGVLWYSGKKGWREEPNKPLMVCKDKDVYGIVCQFLGSYHKGETIQNPPLHNYGTVKVNRR